MLSPDARSLISSINVSDGIEYLREGKERVGYSLLRQLGVN